MARLEQAAHTWPAEIESRSPNNIIVETPMSADAEFKLEGELVKSVMAAHESVARSLTIFIPMFAALFVVFQNAETAIDILGAKFTRSQGALVAVVLVAVTCCICVRNLFIMRDLLGQIHDKTLVRKLLQSSAVPLNPFANTAPAFFVTVFNYMGLVLMHIAPLGVVLAYSDLIIAAQRSLLLAGLHFVLALAFLTIYFLLYRGLACVIEIVNPESARARRRILVWSIVVVLLAFLIYGHVANMENVSGALQIERDR
jgi:hypothetical protein